jgi:hypothetical protein
MKLFSWFCAFAVWVAVANAGPHLESSKSTVTPPPCPSWYADKEWNVNLWATYAFTRNDYPAPDNTISQGQLIRLNGDRVGFEHDSYLGSEHAWGGGIDVKYFFKRYFGIGIEGLGLNARRSFGTVTALTGAPNTVGTPLVYGTGHDDRIIGSVLGTFTLRYPIGCSRFAPYIWIAGGTIFGGGEADEVIVFDVPAGAIIERIHRDSETKALGQFGGGFEVRLTPHIGLTNDFSWNVIDGSNNNFGMARTGINFAF